jgi:hypothetical protein
MWVIPCCGVWSLWHQSDGEPRSFSLREIWRQKTLTVSFHVDVPPPGYAFGSLSWHGRDARLTMPLVVKV